jgi:hypothetical protein
MRSASHLPPDLYAVGALVGLDLLVVVRVARVLG